MAADFVNGNLGEALKAEMIKAREKNKLPVRGGFISQQVFQNLLTVDSIKEQLKGDVNPRNCNDFERGQLAECINQNGKKLYVTLILIGKSSRISQLMENKIYDKVLFGEAARGMSSSFCSLERLRNVADLADFAEAFYRQQWVFPPTLMAKTTQVFDVKHFIFPFANERRRLGSGSFGEVWEVKLPGGYLEPLESRKISTIAYKKIRRERKDTNRWNKVMREVKVLRAREHRNITCLFASFIAGHEDTEYSKSSEECLYLLLPRAVTDMDKWMKNEPSYLSKYDDDAFRKHIHFDAMMGLIMGLTFIHREIKGEVGYHRDIKPSNILLFLESGSQLVWKISDFGTSNLKSIEDTGTTSVGASNYWAPPEFFLDKSSTSGETHGRAHDVFSLGCVFLCLVTILKWRWADEGIVEFERRRLKSYDAGEEDIISTASEHAFHNTMNAVRSWVEELKSSGRRDQYQEILELIGEMILPRDERIFAWEVEVDLYDLIDRNRDPNEVNDRLEKVIQLSLNLDLRSKHKPWARAKKKKRPQEFLFILEKSRWFEYSPQSTAEGSGRVISPHHPISMLGVPGDDKRLYGGQDYYHQISSCFARSETVVLYGVGGVGKTRLAEEYAAQFASTDNDEMKKHTLTLNARSTTDLQHSYELIADAIKRANNGTKKNRKVAFGGKDIANDVISWLEDERNGCWFLVVDGLDTYSASAPPRLPCPKPGNQMLITTRNRKTVKHLDLYREGVCIEIEPPSPEDCLRILNYYLDKTLFRNQMQHAEARDEPENFHAFELLETLWTPTLIQRAANYMNENHTPIWQMSVLMKDKGFSQVTTFSPDYLEEMLCPLLAGPLEAEDTWTPEIQLLFMLSFFDRSGVEYSLLTTDYQEERRTELESILGTLLSCSLIKAEGEDSFATFIINGNIQSAIINWVKTARGKALGRESFLQRYNRMLSLLYRYFTKRKKVNGRATKVHDEKLPLMRHFECFLHFVKQNPMRLSFLLHDTAVRAITIFSQVLLDMDRFEEAISVLEYANDHFRVTPSQEESADPRRKKQHRIKFWLGRQLVTAYIARPEDQKSNSCFGKAVKLITILTKEAMRVDGHEVGWGQDKVLQRELTLDLVRLRRESDCYPEAWSEWRKLKGLRLILHDDKVELPTYEDDISDNFDESKRREAFLQKLSIQVTREEGLLYLAESSKLSGKNISKRQRDSWRKAKSSLFLAKMAVVQWFDDDHKMLLDICVDIAVVDAKTGEMDLVRDAVRVLENQTTKLEERYGSCRRTWTMQLKLDAARLKGDDVNVRAAVESLESLLRIYESKLGNGVKETIRCAAQLREAYLKTGRRGDAQSLVDRYPSLPVVPKHKSFHWGLKWILFAFVASAVGSALYRPLAM